MRRPVLLLTLLSALLAAALAAVPPPADPDTRAAAVVAQLRPDERTILTVGVMALPFADPAPIPPDAVIGAGFVPGIPRLHVPPLRETDASLGIAWVLGSRHDGATALPSGLAQGATWNTELMRAGGAMIGSEARAKGFNVLLAGGMNLMCDPRNGRTFEYLGEDPLHSGLMAGAAVSGIQSMHVISTVKHYALKGQETGRKVASSNISDAAARFTVTNSGAVAGQEIAQLYLLAAPQGERRRLLGWVKLALRPGESKPAEITIDRRLLADFDSRAQRWHLAAGRYTLAAGPSSAELPLKLQLQLRAAEFGR